MSKYLLLALLALIFVVTITQISGQRPTPPPATDAAWEAIPPVDSGNVHAGGARTPVPGGWLVWMNGGDSRKAGGCCFVPDPNGEWRPNSNRPLE